MGGRRRAWGADIGQSSGLRDWPECLGFWNAAGWGEGVVQSYKRGGGRVWGNGHLRENEENTAGGQTAILYHIRILKRPFLTSGNHCPSECWCWSSMCTWIGPLTPPMEELYYLSQENDFWQPPCLSCGLCDFPPQWSELFKQKEFRLFLGWNDLAVASYKYKYDYRQIHTLLIQIYTNTERDENIQKMLLGLNWLGGRQP